MDMERIPLNFPVFFHFFIEGNTNLNKAQIWELFEEQCSSENDGEKTINIFSDSSYFYKILQGNRALPSELQVAVSKMSLGAIENWLHKLNLSNSYKNDLIYFRWMHEQDLLEYNQEYKQDLVSALNYYSSFAMLSFIFQLSVICSSKLNLKMDNYKSIIAEYKGLAKGTLPVNESWPGRECKNRVAQYTSNITKYRPSSGYYAFLLIVKYCYEHKEGGCTLECLKLMATKYHIEDLMFCNLDELADMLVPFLLDNLLYKKWGIYKPVELQVLQFFLSPDELAAELGIRRPIRYYY